MEFDDGGSSMMEVTEMTENTTPHYSRVTTLQSTDTRHQYSRETSPPNLIQEGIPGRGRIPPRETSGAPVFWFYS